MAGASGLPLAGVEAIVEGLSSFQGDIRKMNSSLDSIRPQSTLLQNAVSGAWEMMGNFGREILNVAEYALGKILADAIEWAITKLGELASATLEAGQEFQTLELRLQGLNVDALTKSGLAYNEATKEATKLTKEQLEWLQKLAAQTPYDNTDISNIYTLARTYGFADDQAKELTESVVDFASGMGLGGETLERVIMNLGQMVQRGKITSTEMRDLARGAFLPLDDILQRIADDLNASGKGLADNSEDVAKAKEKLADYNDQMEVLLQRQAEFTDKTKESVKMKLANQIEDLQQKIDETTASMGDLQASSGKLTVKDIMAEISKPGGGLPAQLFIDAFNEMVKGEDRFKGASERMAKTFQAASDNALDMVKSIGGLNVVKPILDVIGAKLSSFISLFTDNPQRWNQLTAAATRVGEAISSIVESLFDLLPSTGDLANRVVQTVNGVADWITAHKEDIINFFKGIGDTIQNKVIPWIQDHLVPAFQEIMAWVDKNGPLIWQFFGALGDIIGTVFGNLTQNMNGGGTGSFLESLTAIMQYIVENKDKIAEWAEILVRAFIAFEVLATVWTVIGNAIITLITSLISLGALFVTITAVASSLGPILTAIGAFITGGLVPAVAILVAGLGWLSLGFVAAIAGLKAWQFAFETIFPAVLEVVKLILNAIITEVTFRMQALVAIWTRGVEAVQDVMWSLEEFVTERIDKMKLAFTDIAAWVDIGEAIIGGVARGIYTAAGSLITAVLSVAMDAVDAAKTFLGIQSPSKLFAGIGEMTMEGFAEGIQNAAGVAASAMQSAMSQVSAPAVTMSAAAASASGNTYNNESNYNLNIQSSANTEPIMQDFKMLQALQGS